MRRERIQDFFWSGSKNTCGMHSEEMLNLFRLYLDEDMWNTFNTSSACILQRYEKYNLKEFSIYSTFIQPNTLKKNIKFVLNLSVKIHSTSPTVIAISNLHCFRRNALVYLQNCRHRSELGQEDIPAGHFPHEIQFLKLSRALIACPISKSAEIRGRYSIMN